MSNITLQEKGRRIYIVGNSFPIKDAIKEAGGHWDADEKAWWIGAGKKAAIERAIAGSKPQGFPTGKEIVVKGRAEYKGRQYLFSWSGETKFGHAFKLVFSDGSKEFFANAAEVKVIKTYGKPLTIAKLEQLRAEMKSGGSPRRNSMNLKRCWECGGEFSYSDAKQNEGDWEDSYCGC